jgi:hypothetical protein
MNSPDMPVSGAIQSRMSEIIIAINRTLSMFESDKLHNELRILDWVFYKFVLTK